MDLSTAIGIIAGFVVFSVAIVLGGSASSFINYPSIAIVLGGTIAAVVASYPLATSLGSWKVAAKAFRNDIMAPGEVIRLLVRFAERARREGLLALEEEVMDLDQPFMQKGVQLVVDGTDPELVRSILETELDFQAERHSNGSGVFRKVAEVAPAFGMLGTLVGLIQMLSNLNDPSKIGPGLATALITTLYGAMLANVVFSPLANKLEIKSEQERLLQEIMVEGILSIQAGDNPRIVEEKLKSFLPPGARELEEEEPETEAATAQAEGAQA